MNAKNNEKGAKNAPQKTNFVQKLRLKVAKPYNSIHKESKYDESQNATNLSKSYSDAEKLLQDKPYAERIKPVQIFWNCFILQLFC